MSRKDGYRILSLDGGGSWALLQVMALKAIYGDIPGPVLLSQFDLVAANSGGSIVLAALAEGMPLSEVEAFFLSEQRRRSVFVALPWWRKYLRPSSVLRLFGIGPRYSTRAKMRGLLQLLPGRGKMPLDVLSQTLAGTTGRPTDFLIASCDYFSGLSVFFRSNRASRAASFPRASATPLAEAVHASSNAPIDYFDRPAEFSDCRYWDGAVSGYNNPVLAAVMEALANNVSPSTIAVLSIGTGTVKLPLADGQVRPPLARLPGTPSLPNDLRKMSTSILDDPPDAATYIAHVALHQPLPDAADQPISTGSIVRLNPVIRPVKEHGHWRLPKGLSEKDFVALANLGMDAVAQEEVALIQKLGTEWLADHVPNQAIRSGQNFACEIGQATFSEAAHFWHCCS